MRQVPDLDTSSVDLQGHSNTEAHQGSLPLSIHNRRPSMPRGSMVRPRDRPLGLTVSRSRPLEDSMEAPLKAMQLHQVPTHPHSSVFLAFQKLPASFHIAAHCPTKSLVQWMATNVWLSVLLCTIVQTITFHHWGIMIHSKDSTRLFTATGFWHHSC